MVIGIIYQVTVCKSDAKDRTVEQLEQALSKEVAIHHYVLEETPGKYEWTISPALLMATNVINFLQRQFDLLYDEPDECRDQLLRSLQGMNSHEELVSYAKEGSAEYFYSYTSMIMDSIALPKPGWHSERIMVAWSPIVFHSEGKMILECYQDTFRYIDNLMRLQRHEFPIVDCVKVLIV